jgi:hypothetical protein
VWWPTAIGKRTPDPVHTHTYLLKREKNSSCVRVENEALGIQEGENKVNEGGKRSGFQYESSPTI